MRLISVAVALLVCSAASAMAENSGTTPPANAPPSGEEAAPITGAGRNSPTAPPGVSGYRGGANGIPTDCPPGSPSPDCQQAATPETGVNNRDIGSAKPPAVKPGMGGPPAAPVNPGPTGR